MFVHAVYLVVFMIMQDGSVRQERLIDVGLGRDGQRACSQLKRQKEFTEYLPSSARAFVFLCVQRKERAA